MCNRFRSIHAAENSPRALREALRFNFEFNPNVAPTDVVPVYMARLDGPPQAVMARFGVSKAQGGKTFALTNARTDKIRQGSHRTGMKARRCIIPALGFYEWRDEDGKQPYYFSRKDGQALMLAGIWEESSYKGDDRPAFMILTDEPNALVAPYHDRMPVALRDECVDTWLDLGQAVTPDASIILAPDQFHVRPMDRAMNSPSVKDLAKIDPEAVAA